MAAVRIASPAEVPCACAPSPFVRYAVVYYQYSAGGEKLSTFVREPAYLLALRALRHSAEQRAPGCEFFNSIDDSHRKLPLQKMIG